MRNCAGSAFKGKMVLPSCVRHRTVIRDLNTDDAFFFLGNFMSTRFSVRPALSLLTTAVLGVCAAPSAHAQSAELIAAAKAEGQLTVIALARNWCGYGPVIDAFKAKYGLKVNELNPDASSGDEVEAIKANKDNKGPQAPDTIDVGLSFGPAAKAAGLIQPYKVSTWSTIPDSAKDPEGYWYGDYYGVLAFEVNTDIIPKPPTDWADLLKPEFKNSVALAGDPRSANQAIQGVYAAGLAMSGSCPSPAWLPVCMSRPSVPMHPTPMPPSCGWNTCTPTKASKDC
jgi:hypothetical protein